MKNKIIAGVCAAVLAVGLSATSANAVYGAGVINTGTAGVSIQKDDGTFRVLYRWQSQPSGRGSWSAATSRRGAR